MRKSKAEAPLTGEWKDIIEIWQEMSRAQEWVEACETEQDCMTYEDGVLAALNWVIGIEKLRPIESEYSTDEDDEEETDDFEDDLQ